MKNQNYINEKFENYYHQIYGDNWNNLKQILSEPVQSISLSDKLKKNYFMDRASIIAAQTLPVQKDHSLLDMCAAPGGKTLVLALKLHGTGMLVCNDRSGARRTRLKKVIDECLTDEYKNNIKITGYDSRKWAIYERNKFDCILLDAPCSSERHVLQNTGELKKWSENRPKILAINQFSMLCSALEAVKINGYILYCTCSINPLENHFLIKKFIKKRNDRIKIIDLDFSDQLKNCNKEEYGNIILPDRLNNIGPIFFCLIRRLK